MGGAGTKPLFSHRIHTLIYTDLIYTAFSKYLTLVYIEDTCIQLLVRYAVRVKFNDKPNST